MLVVLLFTSLLYKWFYWWVHQLCKIGNPRAIQTKERQGASGTTPAFRHWSDVLTSSRFSQDSTALSSAGISGSWSCICLPDTSSSCMTSPLPDVVLACGGSGCGTGAECSCKKFCAAADARSLIGLTRASKAAASSARTRQHSFSISLMLALNCCRGRISLRIKFR